MKKFYLIFLLIVFLPSMVFSADPDESIECLRYQLLETEGMTRVFDTHTGKIYIWVPKNKETGEDAHVLVIDPVRSTGEKKKISWILNTSGEK